MALPIMAVAAATTAAIMKRRRRDRRRLARAHHVTIAEWVRRWWRRLRGHSAQTGDRV